MATNFNPLGARANDANLSRVIQGFVPQVRKTPPGRHFRSDDRDPKIATQGTP